MRQDSIALAVRNGEVSATDAQTDRVDWTSMGFGEPEEDEVSAATPASPAAPATAPRRGFDTAVQPLTPRTAPVSLFANQASYGSSPTGMRSAAATAKWDATLLPTSGKQSPYAGIAPAQLRGAMTAQTAPPSGWQQETD